MNAKTSRFLNRGGLIFHTLILITGATGAQLVPLFFSPIISRLYTAEQFGVFAFFTSICSLLTVIATGKYELAILKPKSEMEARSLLIYSLALTVINSILFGIIAFLVFLLIPDKDEHYKPLFFLIPIGVFATGTFHLLYYWANRNQRTSYMARSKVIQAISSCFVQTTQFFLPFGSVTLILGQIIGQLSAIYFLFIKQKIVPIIFGEKRPSLLCKRAAYLAKRFIDYPKLVVPGQLMSVAYAEIPVVFLTLNYDPSIAGVYTFAVKFVTLPITIIFGAFGEVFFRQAAAQYSLNGSCQKIFLKSFMYLLVSGVSISAVVFFCSPSFFPLFFGEAWRYSGQIASSLAVLLFFQITCSTLSGILYISGWLKYEFWWQVARLFTLMMLLLISLSLSLSVSTFIILFITCSCVLYSFYGAMQFLAVFLLRNQ